MDVSIWDLERVFAKGPVMIGEKAAGKRKKGELEDGEVWRAKNVSQGNKESSICDFTREFPQTGDMNRVVNKVSHNSLAQLPNNHLSLRTPIHHLCLTILPSTPGSTTTATSTSTSIVTGTKSGHVRRYDTRQRKPVDGWKVAREGGIGAVQAGLNEQ